MIPRRGVLRIGSMEVLVFCLVAFAISGVRPQAVTPSVTTVPNDVLRRAFPPPPPGRAPEVSLPEVLMRSANDISGSLANRQGTPAARQPNAVPIPTLRAVTAAPIDAPANQYA